MLSFREYIKEISMMKISYDEDDIKFILNTIRKDCRYYLQFKEVENRPLYRGIRKTKGDFVKKQVRKDRIPVDTNDEVHDTIDYFFLEEFGHRYRSNAIFTTSDENEAKQFGYPYLCFPIGRFEFIWSPNIKDFTKDYMPRIKRILRNRYIGGPSTDSSVKEIIDNRKTDFKDHDLVKLLNKMNYKEKEFNNALHSGHEIMIKADSYYIVNANVMYSSIRVKYPQIDDKYRFDKDIFIQILKDKKGI